MYKGHSQIIDTPFPKENERFIHQLETQLFYGVSCGGWILLQTVSTKSGRKEKNSTFEREPQRRPYTIINFPSSQNCHSLHAFSQFWEQERITDE